MDEVERTFLWNIRLALMNRDINMLKELIPNLSIEELENYIEDYSAKHETLMTKIRNSEDTTILEDEMSGIVYDLFRQANLSGNKRLH